MPRQILVSLVLSVLPWLGCTSPPDPFPPTTAPLVELWTNDLPAFGVFVPSAQPQRDADGDRLPPVYTREGAERLARDPLLDYLFLNLEGDYDATAVDALVAGLATVSPPERPALLVRIPSIERDGEQAARERVRDALGRGADGIVLPHVRNAEEARIAVRFFEEAEADVWSPANPDGRIIAMLMIEDPNALETAQAIADTPGYSMLSCGIGSLTAALGGDRDAGEAGADVVRHHAARVGLPSMMTANPANMLDRLNQGYRALLLQMGDETVDAIRLGRRMAGR
ncbi:MAG: aldolase/citrate lyase family protein [Vicinamibacterales bacterium]|nr:aldolase/citrate lyase family protein [Vicinamibacterales bacterium]